MPDRTEKFDREEWHGSQHQIDEVPGQQSPIEPLVHLLIQSGRYGRNLALGQ
jgi:hypothetical protein